MGFWNEVRGQIFGTPDTQQSIYDPQQQQLLSQVNQTAMQGGGLQNNPLYQQSGNFLQNLLSNSPQAMSAFEGPARQQFNQQIIPGLAERFAGSGSGNQSSSAFQNALGGAGATLATNLQALRSGLQMQALPFALQHAQAPIDALRGLASVGLNRSSFQTQPGSPGFLPAAGAAAGAYFGGPAGAAAGKEAGGLISNWFKAKPSNTLAEGNYGMYPDQGNYNPYTDNVG